MICFGDLSGARVLPTLAAARSMASSRAAARSRGPSRREIRRCRLAFRRGRGTTSCPDLLAQRESEATNLLACAAARPAHQPCIVAGIGSHRGRLAAGGSVRDDVICANRSRNPVFSSAGIHCGLRPVAVAATDLDQRPGAEQCDQRRDGPPRRLARLVAGGPGPRGACRPLLFNESVAPTGVRRPLRSPRRASRASLPALFHA